MMQGDRTLINQLQRNPHTYIYTKWIVSLARTSPSTERVWPASIPSGRRGSLPSVSVFLPLTCVFVCAGVYFL